MGTKNNNLVVLGAGWLGQALCLDAKKKGWQVQGTHRSTEHNHDFLRQLELKGNQLIHQLDLEDAFWVCAIPPRSRDDDSDYLVTLEKSLALGKSLNCKGFILCSSTGVYNSDNQIYDEQSDITCTTQRQQRLYDAEQLALGAGGKVIRLAGLLGPGREPGRFVAGKQLNSSSQQVVNMVHQQDVINAINTLMHNWQNAASVYNVVNSFHPTKADYYRQKSQQHGTAMPSFLGDEKAERIVDGSAIEGLGFNYQYDI
ncbi:NADP-binding protein [Pseudoalteromonas sp.]|uniref:NADP-binding protein n=1 Tax=Pseudoalteromonas sp. TaxID=53249 RepID=UPI003F958944